MSPFVYFEGKQVWTDEEDPEDENRVPAEPETAPSHGPLFERLSTALKFECKLESLSQAIAPLDLILMISDLGLLCQTLHDTEELNMEVREDNHDRSDALGNVQMYHVPQKRMEHQLLKEIGASLVILAHEGLVCLNKNSHYDLSVCEVTRQMGDSRDVECEDILKLKEQLIRKEHYIHSLKREITKLSHILRRKDQSLEALRNHQLSSHRDGNNSIPGFHVQEKEQNPFQQSRKLKKDETRSDDRQKGDDGAFTTNITFLTFD